ncbi:hypothetical protein HMPREF2892_09155 [Aerococcus sp. HMSC061A03]|uniref:DUF5633 domain-containing protein n=1 Tax=Aerococcus sp. HMSC061A03 TaxID=1739396 RepID=UPI0008A64B6B|nr:DUF5633 domain-containing protein [Aerococcus sp. HMSC061A03]OFR31400.1 hypothetical protein HMPREF2892_09155 [Aerococcus sp. HMSC061A03]
MNFKKVLLGSIATTAAVGTLFASQLQVAEAAAYETPVDENGNVILGGAPDVNPADKSATPGGSNQFKLSVDENGVPTTVSNNKQAKSVEQLKEQNLNEGFKTKAEAEDAAKKVLKEDKVNKSFTVTQGANSNYYYFSLSPNEPAKKADTQDKEATVAELKEQNAGDGFKTKAEAEEAAKTVLKDDKVNKSFTVSQGANSNYYFLLSPNEAEETVDTQDKQATVDELKEQNAGDGFKTKAEAEDAAKTVLAEDKVNKSFTVSQGANSNYYFLLSPNEAEEVVEEDKADNKSEDKQEKPSEDKKDHKSASIKELEEQNLNDGFKTKKEAEDAAKKVLKEDKINKSFTVSQGANDNYYYLLSPNEAAAAGQSGKKTEGNQANTSEGKKSEAKPSEGKENTKGEDKKSDKQVAADKKVAAKKSDAVKANGKKEAAKKAKTTLPKTGAVASAAPAVLGLALASVGTAFAFGKKKEDK